MTNQGTQDSFKEEERNGGSRIGHRRDVSHNTEHGKCAKKAAKAIDIE